MYMYMDMFDFSPGNFGTCMSLCARHAYHSTLEGPVPAAWPIGLRRSLIWTCQYQIGF